MTDEERAKIAAELAAKETKKKHPEADVEEKPGIHKHHGHSDKKKK